MSNKKKKSTKNYWYEFHISECVLCGRPDDYKIRIYDRPKPKRDSDRFIVSQYVCGIHFC